jgi:prepilin-type N-terminal cleavage/methylation domain-containing protein
MSRHPHGRGGLTLIELLVVLAVMAVLAAVAAPSMAEFIARQRVESTANELMADLRMARSTTIQTNRPVTMVFGTTGTTRCYAIILDLDAAPICDCTRGAGAVCTMAGGGTPPTEIKTVTLNRRQGITMKASATRYEINGATAMASIASFGVEVNSADGGRLKVLTNITGRPLICNLSGRAEYPTCP